MLTIKQPQHFPRMSVSVEPVNEPVSPQDVLRFAGYYSTDDDAVSQMQSFVTAARQEVERRGSWALITQTRRVKYDRFPSHCLELPIYPVQSVSSITYLDANGDSQTLSASLYQVDTAQAPARIMPVETAVWPSTQGGTFNAVTVTFVAGFGSDPEDVPERIRLAIKFLARSYSPWGMCGDADTAGTLIEQATWRPLWV